MTQDRAPQATRSQANPQAATASTIEEQRRAIRELQTPVIQVWEGILALPIVGALDTARSQEMTETLLQRIVETGSDIVILDITAVPVIDTAVAKHLLETVAAARLLGAEVLIVGLTTRTAMTLVHLGVDLGGVTTRTTLAKGLELAFSRLGLEVTRRAGGALRTAGSEAAGASDRPRGLGGNASHDAARHGAERQDA
ncbi:MAG TPA: STAS domain-containing protein [Chloroflexota bacterium]|nr:STAS domain-containing protein [Chloroflexota bacterium]